MTTAPALIACGACNDEAYSLLTTWATETIRPGAPVSRATFTFLLVSVELNNWGSDQAGLELDPINSQWQSERLVYAYQPRSKRAAAEACCLIKSRL